MSEDNTTKPTSSIRPPDLPQGMPSCIPPPAPQSDASAPAAGPVHVRIREGGGDQDRLSANGLAPFNTRVIAALIDIVVAAGVMAGAIFILPDFAERIGWLLGPAYLVVRDSLPFLGGQSVGKTAMKLKVVTLEGKDLLGNWPSALVRNGVLAIPFFPLVELFVLLSREDTADRGIRLGDSWAKTKVVPAPPAVSPSDDSNG